MLRKARDEGRQEKKKKKERETKLKGCTRQKEENKTRN